MIISREQKKSMFGEILSMNGEEGDPSLCSGGQIGIGYDRCQGCLCY